MWVVAIAVPRVLPPGLVPVDRATRRRRRPDPRGAPRTGGPTPRGRPPVRRVRATISRDVPQDRAAEGPRVISARLPGARSVSIAAYVLAGSRLEPPAEAGVAHFMEHLTFKGTAGYPSSRAISEAVEGVGGSANAATDRESTVYWARVPRREAATAMGVLGELDRPSHARRCRHRPGADGDRRGDPLLPRRPVRVRPDAHPAGAVRRRAAGPRDLRRRGGHPRAADRGTIRDFWRADVPAREHGRRRRGRPVARGGGRARDGGVRDRRTASLPRSIRRPTLPAGPRVLTGKPRHDPGAAGDRRAGAPARPPRRVDPAGAQRRAGRRDVAAACSSACARRRGWPTT